MSFDLNNFNDELSQSLAVLREISEQDQTEWVSSLDIANHLRDVHGIGIHWRRIDTLFGRRRSELIDRRKRGKRWHYRILKDGVQFLENPGETALLVNPANAVQAVTTLHEMLEGMSGTVKICDPYMDETTIEHLQSLPSASPIRLLTHKITDTGRLRRLIEAMRVEGRDIEIRSTKKAILHDRYLIDDKKILVSGASLNGFGKKQSIVTQLGQDMKRAMTLDFDEKWKDAELFRI